MRSLHPAIMSAMGLVAICSTARAEAVPTPVISSPPAGIHGFAFPKSLEDLEAAGYVEEEFFIEGTARSFVAVAPLDGVSNGQWNAAPTGPSASYKSRLLVRRPVDPAKFNGTVLVDWLNVSAGYDSDTFDSLAPQFMRDGYVYVGVTTQLIGANHLRDTWESGDGARYASLSHPGDSYSYDIFSQAGQALRAGEPRPLADLTEHVSALVAWGGSQSGGRLFTYVNAVHPTAGVYDGFVPFIAIGGAPLSQAPLQDVPVPSGAGAVIRTDASTPVLFQLSESEIVRAGRGIHAQPDSKYFRLWEHAGTAHANSVGVERTMKRMEVNDIPAGVFPDCAMPPMNDLSVFPVVSAMLRAMHRWVTTGEAPRHAPRVDMALPEDPSQPGTFIVDPTTGIARGGIRLPEVAVPRRTLSGLRPADPTLAPQCWAFGASDPWNGDADPWDGDPAHDLLASPEPRLETLYGDEDAYVEAISRAAWGLVAQGFLLPRDAFESIRAARSFTFPQ